MLTLIGAQSLPHYAKSGSCNPNPSFLYLSALDQSRSMYIVKFTGLFSTRVLRLSRWEAVETAVVRRATLSCAAQFLPVFPVTFPLLIVHSPTEQQHREPQPESTLSSSYYLLPVRSLQCNISPLTSGAFHHGNVQQHVSIKSTVGSSSPWTSAAEPGKWIDNEQYWGP